MIDYIQFDVEEPEGNPSSLISVGVIRAILAAENKGLMFSAITSAHAAARAHQAETLSVTAAYNDHQSFFLCPSYDQLLVPTAAVSIEPVECCAQGTALQAGRIAINSAIPDAVDGNLRTANTLPQPQPSLAEQCWALVEKLKFQGMTLTVEGHVMCVVEKDGNFYSYCSRTGTLSMATDIQTMVNTLVGTIGNSAAIIPVYIFTPSPQPTAMSRASCGTTSMMILGGFIAAVGVAAVALALAALAVITLGAAGVALSTVGAAGMLVGIGLFAGVSGKSFLTDASNAPNGSQP